MQVVDLGDDSRTPQGEETGDGKGKEGKRGMLLNHHHPVIATVPLGKFLVKFENIGLKTRSQMVVTSGGRWRPGRGRRNLQGAGNMVTCMYKNFKVT